MSTKTLSCERLHAVEFLHTAPATAPRCASIAAPTPVDHQNAPHNMDADDQLGRARVKLTNVWATMKGVFARAWDHKSVCFFVGSVILMHAFGDELAV